MNNKWIHNKQNLGSLELSINWNSAGCKHICASYWKLCHDPGYFWIWIGKGLEDWMAYGDWGTLFLFRKSLQNGGVHILISLLQLNECLLHCASLYCFQFVCWMISYIETHNIRISLDRNHPSVTAHVLL